MDQPPDETLIHWLFGAWSWVLSLLGGILMWNWNKLTTDVDRKADHSDLEQLRAEFYEGREAQERMHTENRRRLDDIYQLLATGKRRDER
jgi:hypothetical protein